MALLPFRGAIPDGLLYDAEHEQITPEAAARYLCCGASNPSSLMNCIALARVNARAMRPDFGGLADDPLPPVEAPMALAA